MPLKQAYQTDLQLCFTARQRRTKQRKALRLGCVSPRLASLQQGFTLTLHV